MILNLDQCSMILIHRYVFLVRNNMLGDISNISQRRDKNTEKVISVNEDPVSLTFGLGASG